MAKDYAKQSHRRRSAPKGSSNGPVWLLLGIVLGLAIAAFFYFKGQSLPAISHQLNNVLQQAEPSSTVANEPAAKPQPQRAKPAAASTAAPQPKFDFYTILPKAQVADGAATTDSGNVSSAPASPANNAQAAAKLNNAQQALTQSVSATSSNGRQSATASKTATGASNSSAAPTSAATTTSTTNTSAPTTAASATTTSATATPKAAKTDTSSATASTYRLEIAAFKDYADADQLKAQLALLGVDAQIKTVKKAGTNWNEVTTGPYASEAAANKAKQQLADNSIKSVLIKVK